MSKIFLEISRRFFGNYLYFADEINWFKPLNGEFLGGAIFS